MFDFFKVFSKSAKSKDIARDRLKLVLVHDRAGCSPVLLESIKDEILCVLQKYMDIQDADFLFDIQQIEGEGGRVPALVANIPIKNITSNEIAERTET